MDTSAVNIGSFQHIHNGHADLVKEALKNNDHVTIIALDEKCPDILAGDGKNPSVATHKDVYGDYWLITRANCLIWHSVRGVWVDYANYDEIDMSLLTPTVGVSR